MRIERELMRGAGPVAVLKLLEGGEMYGYELVDALAKRSEGVLAMGQSTLYPLLYNLESQKFVSSTRREGPNGRTRKYYRLTGRGRTRLDRDVKQWAAVTSAMNSIGVLTTPRDTHPPLGGCSGACS